MPSVSITDWMQNPQTVGPGAAAQPSISGWGGLGDGPAPVPSGMSTTVKVLLVGASVGALYALFRKKK